jgi:hypothetical protein
VNKSRFIDSLITEALKRVEAGLAVPELCREMGISSATFLPDKLLAHARSRTASGWSVLCITIWDTSI